MGKLKEVTVDELSSAGIEISDLVAAGAKIEDIEAALDIGDIGIDFDRVAVLDEDPWALGATDRGTAIDNALGNNVGHNYPVIDKFDEATGNVTSIKSYDTAAQTYQTTDGFANKITADIDKLADFKGRTWGETDISLKDITSKTLEIVIPPTPLTPAQVAAINSAEVYAASKDIELIITIVR